jgi:hypothetical protein
MIVVQEHMATFKFANGALKIRALVLQSAYFSRFRRGLILKSDCLSAHLCLNS